MSELAPIGVSTYIRLEHLKKTISALQQNTLAKESRLFVFSDAPKLGDEDKVRKIREYLHTIDSFKEITILERSENSRIKNNRGGIRQLLDESGKCIFLEEDVVTAPGFLEFINKGLEYYKDDLRILSIGAHTPNLRLYEDYHDDFYFIDRFHGWGFGIWQDRYDLIDYIPRYEEIKNNKNAINVLKNMGDDMLPMIKLEAEGKIDALDIKACYLMSTQQMVNVLPTQTLVKNIGLDGSGMHCGNQDDFATDILSQVTKFKFGKYKKIDPIIEKQYKKFFSKSIVFRLKNKIKCFLTDS